MRPKRFILSLLAASAVAIPAAAGEIVIPDDVRQASGRESERPVKVIPVDAEYATQSAVLFRTWTSGSIDLGRSVVRPSRRFDRTSYIQQVREDSVRLPAERLDLTPVDRLEPPAGAIPRPPSALTVRSAGAPRTAAPAARSLVLPRLRPSQIRREPSVKPMKIVYREGEGYFKFQKFKEKPVATAADRNALAAAAKSFLVENAFLRETETDRIGNIVVRDRRINEEAGAGGAPVVNVVQQDVLFHRTYEGRPVINSRVTVGFQPGGGDIVLLHLANWTTLGERRGIEIVPHYVKDPPKVGPAAILRHLERKIREGNGNFTRAQVREVIPAWYQSGTRLLPVLAFSIDIEHPSPRGPLRRSYLEVINMAGDDAELYPNLKSRIPPTASPG